MQSKGQWSRSQVRVVYICPQIDFWMITPVWINQLYSNFTYRKDPYWFWGQKIKSSRSQMRISFLFTNLFPEDNLSINYFQASPSYSSSLKKDSYGFLGQKFKGEGQGEGSPQSNFQMVTSFWVKQLYSTVTYMYNVLLKEDPC